MATALTSNGDSLNFYGSGLDILPFQGVCQGNGAGSAVWLTLSICLIHMLHTFSHTSTISSAITLSTLALSGLLYVDDSDLFILADSPSESPASVIHQLQTNTQLWQAPGTLQHAPSSLYGLALPSILWEQGIVALCLLLECSNGPSMAGSLLQISVEQAQLEVGSLTPFYQLPFQQYGFLLTNCWLKSVWSFLSSAQLCLQSSQGSGLQL